MGFKENLKEQLSFSGMYVKELSALSGVKKQTIDSYLREDSCTPLVESAVAIAQALGVSVEFLVTGKENAKSKMTDAQIRHKEIIEILAKLNNYNYEVITSMAKTLLNLQSHKK